MCGRSSKNSRIARVFISSGKMEKILNLLILMKYLEVLEVIEVSKPAVVVLKGRVQQRSCFEKH